jgi:hypothetical protein
MKRGCRKPAKKVKATPEVKSAEKLGNNAAAEDEVSKPWFDGKETELADDLDYAKVLRLLGKEEPDDAVLAFGDLR